MKKKSEHLKSFHIAGFTYYDGAMVMEKLRIGKSLTLVLDPENKFDARAVCIYRKGVKLGYVPRAENEFIYKLLKTNYQGLKCVVQGRDKSAHPEQQIYVAVSLNG